MSGLEGLAGTPVRVQSPAVGTPAGTSNNLDDLLGVFGGSGEVGASSSGQGFAANGGAADITNGFSGLDLSSNGNEASRPKKPNEDILSLF